MTQAFTQGEPNLLNEPIENSSETSLSLPEALSLLTPFNPFNKPDINDIISHKFFYQFRRLI